MLAENFSDVLQPRSRGGVMNRPAFAESVVEEAALAWLEALGYAVLHGPDIAVGSPAPSAPTPATATSSSNAGSAQALARLNPDLPPEALEDAYRKLTRADAPTLLERNRADPPDARRRRDGRVPPARRLDRRRAGARHRLRRPGRTTTGSRSTSSRSSRASTSADRTSCSSSTACRSAVIELKNAADEDATIWPAFHQLQTYQAQIPALFATTPRWSSRTGRRRASASLGAGREWFKPWRTIDGRPTRRRRCRELQVAPRGRLRAAPVPRPRPPLRRLRGRGWRRRSPRRCRATTSSTPSTSPSRRRCGPRRLPPASIAPPRPRPVRGRPAARRRAGRPARRRRLAHPGLGQEPDDGLLRRADRSSSPRWRTRRSSSSPTATTSTTSSSAPSPAAATCSARTRSRRPTGRTCARSCSVASGGVVFTTIQKFLPEEKGDRHPVLSDRRNIVVIADEAHRSQYDFIDGFARHMRDALPERLVHRLHRHARSSRPTPTPAPSSATTSASTTSSARSTTARPSRSTTRAGSPSSRCARPSARDRPRLRGGHRGRGGRAQGAAQDQVGAARGDRRRREADPARRPGPRRPLRGPPRGDGRQGDGRVHEPPDRVELYREIARAPARVGRRRRRRRARSRS